MKRTLTFEQIADERFNLGPVDLKRINTSLLSKLSAINGIYIEIEEVRELPFVIHGNTVKSYRQRYYIQKKSNEFTWRDIFKIVNSVKAVHYAFIHRNDFSTKNA